MSNPATNDLACPHCQGTGRIPDPVAVGAELRAARKRAGLTQRAMARILGISFGYLCDIEKGRRIATHQRARAWAKLMMGPEQGRW